MVENIKSDVSVSYSTFSDHRFAVPFSDQKRLVEKHEDGFNRLYTLFLTATNSVRKENFAQEVQKFREAVLRDVRRFFFHNSEDITLLRALYKDAGLLRDGHSAGNKILAAV